VLGKPPTLARHSSAPRDAPAPLVLEAESVVCCKAVVFAGARLGERAIVGDQAYVRERTVIGPGSVIGRGSAVDNDVVVGARVRVQTDVYLTAYSVVEDDVFVGPGVLTTNDSTMARHDEHYDVRGALLRRACRIGGAAVLTPGVEVGEEAFVAAGAVVTKEVPDYALIIGVPGRRVGWVSRHGLPLKDRDLNDIYTCPESGLRYREFAPETLRCLDLDEGAPLPEAMRAGSTYYDELVHGRRPV
jgi:acetyltransferase-like isoleucine patch superfamily enzyme